MYTDVQKNRQTNVQATDVQAGRQKYMLASRYMYRQADKYSKNAKSDST
jgi:hypothetical protein